MPVCLHAALGQRGHRDRRALLPGVQHAISDAPRIRSTARSRRAPPPGTDRVAFWAAHPELPALPIVRWEIWNEPNLTGYWCPGGEPARYADLFVQAASQIRKADPAARLVLGPAAGLAVGRAPSTSNVPGPGARTPAEAAEARQRRRHPPVPARERQQPARRSRCSARPTSVSIRVRCRCPRPQRGRPGGPEPVTGRDRGLPGSVVTQVVATLQPATSRVVAYE